ncbi:MAG: 16S rRNA (uracil(1498)-N(3))-methyltransferase [Clostridia bacterium]|nr:16S rRNA (uracil(1498)-N(3))-methyltransferase [Clostridia bacterium]
MHRFFAERAEGATAHLSPDEAKHAVRVLRLKPGDPIQVVWQEQLYAARLLTAGETATAELLQALPSPEPRTRVTLYQGLPKGDKMDFIAQKVTEAGVHAVVPVAMERCVARYTEKDGARKAERWQRIALEAAKQSGRTHIPRIETPISAGQLPDRLARHPLILVPWEEERTLPLKDALSAHPDARDVAVVIGPEGGMSAEELAPLRAIGAVPVTLGPRIFRTETAGLAALIMLLYEKGDYA